MQILDHTETMKETNRRVRSVLLGVLLLASAASASADTLCVAGNLSGLIGTTCDIGDFRFTFTELASTNDAYIGNTLSYSNPWSVNDFSLAPVANGFTLSFDGGPQSITTGQFESSRDYAVLGYDVSVLQGFAIAGESVVGGTLSASGHGSPGGSGAGYSGTLASTSGEADAYSQSFVQNGPTLYINSQDRLFGYPIVSGGGEAFPFQLGAFDGYSASWDGSPTTFTYKTVFLPEPNCLPLLSIVLISLGGFTFLNHRRGRLRYKCGV